MTTKHDYTALDAGILAAIKAGHSKSVTYVAASIHVAPEAARITTIDNRARHRFQHRPEWMVVDRRLQALRKAGKIAYGGQAEGWLLLKSEGE